jgi:NAD(P)H-hydrate epimerase
MRVGGTGDVLAGITGALLATNPPMKAALVQRILYELREILAFNDKGYGLLLRI